MEINAEKSRIMTVGKEKKAVAQTIKVMGKDLGAVDSFKSLGSKLAADGKRSEEVRSRLGMATSSLMNLNSVWQNSNIFIKTKYRLLITIA